MKPNIPHTLIVSFHDLAPHSQVACKEFLRLMAEVGIERVSLLATPRWHGNEPFSENPDFVDWLREQAAQGHEIQLHGYTHRAETLRGGPLAQWVGTVYTAREGEFYQLTYEEAMERLRAGLALFEKLRLPASGFTPPAWLLSDEARRALIDVGIDYATSHSHIDLLENGGRVFAPTMVFSSRAAWRRAVSRVWVPFWGWAHRSAPIMRLAIHPIDLQFLTIRDTMIRLAREAAAMRSILTYGEAVRAIREADITGKPSI